MYTYDLHTKTPDSRKQIRKNTNFEMKNSKPFLALFSSVCTNVNKIKCVLIKSNNIILDFQRFDTII